jgi:hypothetical protein
VPEISDRRACVKKDLSLVEAFKMAVSLGKLYGLPSEEVHQLTKDIVFVSRWLPNPPHEWFFVSHSRGGLIPVTFDE